MKLYHDPISTTCRPVVLFALEHGIDLEFEHVDLTSAGNLAPDYLSVNPNGVVPYLVDDGFGLGESSAILKYLADKIASPAYPAQLQARARVNADMDWFAIGLNRDFCGFVCYTQLGLTHGLDPAATPAAVAYGQARSARWLAVLEREMLGENPFVGGQSPSLADYLGSAFVTLGELVAFDFSAYPNIRRWIAAMRALPGWDAANAGFNGWLAAQSKVPA